MSNITFSQAKLKGEARQNLIQTVQTQLQAAALQAIKPLLTTFLQEELQAKLGRVKYGPRLVGAAPRSIDWQCSNCGCNDANQFTRDGHYQRSLEKFKRFWLDLDQKALFGTGLCQSLRQPSQEWSSLIGCNVGLRTLNQRINAVEGLIETERTLPIKDVPSVLQLDGIWLSLQTQSDTTETIKVDKRGRKRHKRTGKRMVVLVALGLWSDGSGRRQILDWQLAKSESQAEWEGLLQRLYERGVQAEAGLKVVVRDGGGGLVETLSYVYGKRIADQRCIFHKLKNVNDACLPSLATETKTELMGQAKGIYQAPNAEAARELKAKWVTKWGEVEPKAVASLQRDFEQTLTYYNLEAKVSQLARTTSLLERTNRELRRKFRQVGIWGSEAGAVAGTYLQVARLNTWWAKGSWWQTSQNLFFQRLS